MSCSPDVCGEISFNAMSEPQVAVSGNHDVVDNDSVLSDSVHTAVVHSDLVHNDVVHSDLAHSDLVQSDLVHSDLVHSDVLHSDLVRSDVVHDDIARPEQRIGDNDVTSVRQENGDNFQRQPVEHPQPALDSQLIDNHLTHQQQQQQQPQLVDLKLEQGLRGDDVAVKSENIPNLVASGSGGTGVEGIAPPGNGDIIDNFRAVSYSGIAENSADLLATVTGERQGGFAEQSNGDLKTNTSDETSLTFEVVRCAIFGPASPSPGTEMNGDHKPDVELVPDVEIIPEPEKPRVDFKSGIACNDPMTALDILRTRYKLFSCWNIADVVRGPHKESYYWQDPSTAGTRTEIEGLPKEIVKDPWTDELFDNMTDEEMEDLCNKIDVREKEIAAMLRKILDQDEERTKEMEFHPANEGELSAHKSAAASLEAGKPGTSPRRRRRENAFQRMLRALRKRFSRHDHASTAHPTVPTPPATPATTVAPATQPAQNAQAAPHLGDTSASVSVTAGKTAVVVNSVATTGTSSTSPGVKSNQLSDSVVSKTSDALLTQQNEATTNAEGTTTLSAEADTRINEVLVDAANAEVKVNDGAVPTVSATTDVEGVNLIANTAVSAIGENNQEANNNMSTQASSVDENHSLEHSNVSKEVVVDDVGKTETGEKVEQTPRVDNEVIHHPVVGDVTPVKRGDAVEPVGGASDAQTSHMERCEDITGQVTNSSGLISDSVCCDTVHTDDTNKTDDTIHTADTIHTDDTIHTADTIHTDDAIQKGDAVVGHMGDTENIGDTPVMEKQISAA